MDDNKNRIDLIRESEAKAFCCVGDLQDLIADLIYSDGSGSDLKIISDIYLTLDAMRQDLKDINKHALLLKYDTGS